MSTQDRSAPAIPGVPKENVRLSRLTDAEREVYVSCEKEGLRPADLARHVEWSESTIRTYLSRARQKVGESSQ